MMAKFGLEISGLDELSKQLENMENNISNAEGNLSIEKDNILNNIDSFNKTYRTNFSSLTTDDEFIEYFNEQYTSLIQKHIADKVNFKNKFNNKFNGFAHIE